MAETVADVVIAGNGPVAAFLGLALASEGIDAQLVGAGPPPADRPIALSHGSRLLLERVGVFQALHPTPIRTIHVSQQGGFGRTVISAEDHGLDALGHVVSYSELCSALAARLPLPLHPLRVERYTHTPQGSAVVAGGVRGRLLVLAEGGSHHEARRRGREYGQSAVVADVVTEKPHRNGAWERFTPEGPLALLPDGERLALVWSTTHQSAQLLCALREEAFLARLGSAFGARLGRFVHAGPRIAFPLALSYERSSPAPRVVAIGNAAQTLHPVAGQGLNLGLRDAWELAQAITQAREGGAPRDVGCAEFVRAYLRTRTLDRAGGIGMTDALVRVFSNTNPALRAVRGAGLAAMDICPPARRFFARRMMFGARALP